MNIWRTNIMSVFLVFILSISLLSACSSNDGEHVGGTDSEDDYTLRVNYPVAEDHPIHMAMLEFKEQLEQESAGRIDVELFPNGQLYSSERESIEAVQLNNLEMTIVITATLAGFKSEFSIFSLPFLFNTREAAHRAFDGELGDTLNDMLPDINLVGLGYGELGFRHFFNNDGPIEKPADFDGLKVRVLESKIHEDMFSRLGADASPLGFGETYTSIQQGVYDGMDSEISVAATSNLDEILTYLTLSGHTFTPIIALLSKDFYDELPSDLQDEVMAAAETFTELEREFNIQQEEERFADLQEAMEVNELTDEQKDAFREHLRPIYEKYKDDVGEDLIEIAEQTNES